MGDVPYSFNFDLKFGHVEGLVLGHSWIRRLNETYGQSLKDDGIICVGKGGLTFSKAVEFFKNHQILSCNPKWIQILLGSNDADSCSDTVQINDVFPQVIEFLNFLREKFPSSKLILCGVEDRVASSGGFKQKSNKLNKFLLKIKKVKPGLIDFYCPMKGNFRFTDPSLFCEDGIHPNADGLHRLHEIVRGAVWMI